MVDWARGPSEDFCREHFPIQLREKSSQIVRLWDVGGLIALLIQ